MTTRAQKLAEVERLRREVASLESLRHTDPAMFQADDRLGAVLVDATGRVICSRSPIPSRHSSPMTRKLDMDAPMPPLVDTHTAEHLRSIIRDRAHPR